MSHSRGPCRAAALLCALLLAAGVAWAEVSPGEPPGALGPDEPPAGQMPPPDGGVPDAAMGQIPAEADSPDWARTLSRIAPGVVSIRVDSTRAFDTDWNQSTQATGFVVDAERGIVLTNRHVVTPGPVTAMAVFLNQEEVELTPLYRDPVHDFGFFRFDPDDLRFIEPVELALVPEGARVGREIRVVGNDAGEQLSILGGTIARLDRQAPDYGRGRYNDFNTFYVQAASGTSGGSSGSPVIDINGEVVALNAGARAQAQSSYFLPLQRVQRALDLVRNGEPVPRGTLQTTFVSRSYAELRRLGLDEDTEARVRESHPDHNGMLVVDRSLPDSLATDVLEVGDILLAINGESLAGFAELSAVLDDHVEREIELTVQRGGERRTGTVRVGDLHAITPDEYIEFGGAVVHRLSYQQARHYNLPPRGIYVANPGYVFATAAIPRGAVVQQFNGRTVEDLDDLEAEMDGIADGARVAIRFRTMDDPANSQLRIVQMDRRWFPASRCHRDDSRGYWPCRELADPPEAQPPEPASTAFTASGDRRARTLAPSLVLVNFDMPYVVSGVGDRHYHGTGLIVDTERGLVAVDQNTVPVSIGDVRLTFAGSLEVPGRVEYIHPLHNLALVSYDPAVIGDTPVRAARLREQLPTPGDRVWVVGLRGDHRLVSQSTEVSTVEPVSLPLSRSMRARDTNLETVRLSTPPSELDGVVADSNGRVLAMWSSFAGQGGGGDDSMMGMPAELVAETLRLHRSGEPLHSLEVEWRLLPLASARRLGVDEEWLRRYETFAPEQRQLLSAVRVVAGTPAHGEVQPGDVLLDINGELANRFRAVEKASQRDQVALRLWRNGEVVELELPTVALDGDGLDRIMLWAGALLQPPHRALAAQRGIERDGVYVSYFGYGSPASRHGLHAGWRVVEVNGETTPDFDSFARAVKALEPDQSVRLRAVNWNNESQVITLRMDDRYWPAYELRRDGDGWKRRRL